MTQTPIRLTQRGRIVRNIVVGILVFTLWGVLENITTPDKCKVPTSQMDQSCLNLLYP